MSDHGSGCLQGAAIGNTAFLSGIEVQVGTASTEVRVSIRNNATLPGGAQDYFWAGQTQVFVEFLALTPSNSSFEALDGYEGINFVHSVWPGVVTEDDVKSGVLASSRVAPMRVLQVQCMLQCHVQRRQGHS